MRYVLYTLAAIFVLYCAILIVIIIRSTINKNKSPFKNCKNCNNQITGTYCGKCGLRSRPAENLKLPDIKLNAATYVLCRVGMWGHPIEFIRNKVFIPWPDKPDTYFKVEDIIYRWYKLAVNDEWDIGLSYYHPILGTFTIISSTNGNSVRVSNISRSYILSDGIWSNLPADMCLGMAQAIKALYIYILSEADSNKKRIMANTLEEYNISRKSSGE